ncbi:helix-turn-helix domain-containing protein [Nocardia wallacei]|uniref:helix-turn-helix domain-containing protein n=1 Tax=Nocardia wallacei TaxID=480035 RepID=UPI002457344A|nr:helix-turn-helix transcriptional regulator [Nocardia wallacei]
MAEVADGVGARVRKARNFAGWTQARLAQEMNVSRKLVEHVEQGVRAASPSFIAAAARAPHLTAPELHGQPYPRETTDDHRVHAGIPEIRRELVAYRFEPSNEMAPQSYEQLATGVKQASALRHSVRLAELGQQIPALLNDLRSAWHSADGTERERIFALAAETYYAASQVCYKLGYVDLSSLAVDRYEWAAAQSGDELAVLIGDYQRAGELIGTADWDTALQLLERSRAQIEDRISGDDLPALAVWGNLNLKSGLVAARAGQRDLADDFLAEARETADRIGADRDDYRLFFGPTNVGIWSVGLAVEMNDGAEAITRAQDIHLPGNVPKERAGHHFIDLARGYLLHGNHDATMDSLHQAKKIAPMQTRYHPSVHETLRVMAVSQRRRTDTVHGFAAWCGIRI